MNLSAFAPPPFPASNSHTAQQPDHTDQEPSWHPIRHYPATQTNADPPPSTAVSRPILAIDTLPAAQLATQSLLQQHYQQQRLYQQQQEDQRRHQFFLRQQQPQQQQQQQQHLYAPPMNGVNGANMAVGGMPGPSPAGHQAELNYIYGMVEELSKQLAENRRVTEDIVSGLGRVRSRARTQGQGNDELIASAADDINSQQENLDSLISLLSESLEKAKHSRDANASLLAQYAHALTLMLKQFHDYKTKHVADVAAWHRSYRAQLDDARRENSKLREQIWEMQAHASSANEQLRKFRRKYDEDEERWKRRVNDKAMRQELRFWKRMAMPELEDDDSYWSDDDDIVDPAEKVRLAEMERRVLQEQGGESAGEEDADEQQQQQQQHLAQEQFGALSLMGGVAMQRGESQQQQQQQQQQLQPPGQGMPMPPPRPGSAASSTGSTGP